MTDRLPGPDAAPGTDPAAAREPIPARRRALFEGPLFWIGLIVFGLVLAYALSFVPARGETASSKPDVDAFCRQVDVLESTDLVSLVAGVTSQPFSAAPQAPIGPDPTPSTVVVPTTTVDPGGSATTQIEAFDQQLMALEKVAPHEVRTDVHEVRLAIDDVLTALRKAGPMTGIPSTALLFTVSDAQNQIQQAIGRMATYTQDTCGVDIRGPSFVSNPFNR